MTVSKDISGEKFNHLTAVCFSHIHKQPSGKRKEFWLFKCDCGNLKKISKSAVINGHTKTCGCSRPVKHGLGKDKRLYNIYCLMRYRCENKNCDAYKDYGARGIKVCEDWKNPANFKNWAYSNGYKNNLTIERIDVNKGYNPENCCWIPREAQNLNKRDSVIYEFLGIRRNICEWRKLLKIPSTSFYRRIKKESYKKIFAEYLRKKELDNARKYSFTSPSPDGLIKFPEDLATVNPFATQTIKGKHKVKK